MTAPPDNLETLLAAAGINPDTVSAVRRIDMLMQRWRRRFTKRELGHRALAALKIDLDLLQADVLFAVAAPKIDAEVPGDVEPTVGWVAERLMIDPSRASRLVSDLVAAGYLHRTVSQQDSRRTVLELSAAGDVVIGAMQAYKWLIMGQFLNEWEQEDLAGFVPLLEKFSDWTSSQHQEDAEIAAKAAGFAKARTESSS